MTAAADDVIDRMAGVAAGSRLAAVRATRPEVVRAAQASYDLLLAPADPAGVSLVERALIALRVAALTPSALGVAWYRARLRDLDADPAMAAAVETGDPAGLPPRLAAIMRHADQLTRSPGAATPADLAALTATSLTPADIVTIAQLIAFVSFQVRVVAGLRALAEDA
jgi:CMD domain protein